MSNLNDFPPTLPRLENPNSIQLDGLHPQENSVVDADNPVWGVGGALLVWLASFAVQAIIPLLFIIPFAMHRGLNPSSPEFGNEAIKLAVTDPTAILLQVISIVPGHLLTLAVLWGFVTRFGKRPFLASFGWGWSRTYGAWESLGLAALGVALFIIGASLAKVLGADKPTQLEQIINSSIAARYTIAALAVFSAPFIEEFVYRGVVYSALQRLIGVNWAVLFVVLLFTGIHIPQYWPNIGVVSAVALLSVVLTIIRAHSGRLLPCIIIHMSFNAVQALLLIFEPYLQRLLPTTPPAVPTASMLLPLIRSIF